MLDVFDIFCGCGGLSSGLKEAGFNIRWASDNSEIALKSFKLNHKIKAIYHNSATDLLERILSKDSDLPSAGEVDILCGGPPCQGFCGINRFRNPNDERNSLVETYFEIVEALEPRIILMENVNGILSLENGKAVKSLLYNLEKIGYTINLGILQAGCYGTPQSRWRVFICGIKNEKKPIIMPSPLHTFHRNVIFDVKNFKKHVIHPPHSENTLFDNYLPTITVKDAIYDLPKIENGEIYNGPYAINSESVYSKLMRNKKKLVNQHYVYNLGPIMMERVNLLPNFPGACWSDLPEAIQPKNLLKVGKGHYTARFARLEWSKTFTTILTKPDPYWGRFIHPSQKRVISLRESARAQGFKDDFIFEGKITEIYRQIGNAVPPPLARSIGWEIRRSMGDKKVDEEINEYKSNFIDL